MEGKKSIKLLEKKNRLHKLEEKLDANVRLLYPCPFPPRWVCFSFSLACLLTRLEKSLLMPRKKFNQCKDFRSIRERHADSSLDSYKGEELVATFLTLPCA